MTMAANLTEAAALSYAQINLKRVANTTKTQLGTFITAINAIVPDPIATNRPVGNWLIPMAALQATMATTNISLVDFNSCVDYVSKLCWAALLAASFSQITPAQSAAILAAWNTAFGT
jgi:hypothetical protein